MISTPEFLFLSFSPLRYEPSHHDFTLTPSSFTVQTSHLTDSLEEIANSLITIQNQLDSLAAVVLQNRRGLDLLTAEKGGLCLFLEEACCFYANKSGFVKEAARNLTNRASRIHQHLSNSWENRLSDWNWMPWVPPFLGPLLLLTLILSFWPCLMHLFSKILQDHLQAFTNWTIHELLLTHSDYQKLRPHTNPLDPHSSLFFSHPLEAPVPQEAVREDWPSALILNQKGWNDKASVGAHGRNGSWCWPRKQRIKSQWSLKLTKLPNGHSVCSLEPTLLKLWDQHIPDLQLSDHRTQLQAKN